MGLELLYEKKEDSVKILRCFGETDGCRIRSKDFR